MSSATTKTNLPDVPLDENFASRCFINLVQNAYEAMSEAGGGTLRVSIAPRGRVAGATASRCASPIPARASPRELREQIFNPFVTTKKTGVGLGLSIVSKIVDEHHGSIELATDTPGACFVLFFPASAASRRGGAAAGRGDLMTNAHDSHCRRRSQMRRLLELDLGEAGFQTLSAPDAETGLDLLAQGAGAIWCSPI